ncbi:hypothetical protein BDR04DRAFT_1015467, partial [Suillus decipiens]
FKKHGAQWTELAHLPYFNLVQQMIIDPMHNLLLEVICSNIPLQIVKIQWYNQWIQNSTLYPSTDA